MFSYHDSLYMSHTKCLLRSQRIVFLKHQNATKLLPKSQKNSAADLKFWGIRRENLKQGSRVLMACTIAPAAQDPDEVKRYQDARYVSACEGEYLSDLNCRADSCCAAAWRLFSLKMHGHLSPVERLQLHLENQHQVFFDRDDEAEAVLSRGMNAVTNLTGWFAACAKYPDVLASDEVLDA